MEYTLTITRLIGTKGRYLLYRCVVMKECGVLRFLSRVEYGQCRSQITIVRCWSVESFHAQDLEVVNVKNMHICRPWLHGKSKAVVMVDGYTTDVCWPCCELSSKRLVCSLVCPRLVRFNIFDGSRMTAWPSG